MEKTTKSARVQRKPLSQQGPLTISGDKDPNFVYRFVNDTGSRIQRMQQAGYEVVQDDTMIVGDNRAKDAGDMGTAKRVISNDGTTSILMRVKKEWFDEDAASKEQLLRDQEAAMKRDASQGMFGGIKISRD